MSNLNIHVTYGEHTKLFSCSSRREFGSKVSRFFGLDKSEMQMFEISKNSRNPITLNELRDSMKLEIRKNGTKPISKINGERADTTEKEAVKVPDLVDLKRKLTENRVLSGCERKFLFQVVEDFSDSISSTSRKRKKGPEEDIITRPEEEVIKKPITVNKKVQVDRGGEMKQSTYTQTDLVLLKKSNEKVAPSKPSTTKDLITEGKLLARCEKKDLEKVRQLMDDSFEARRQFIMLTNPVLSLVKEKYPLLFSTEEVINELNRIFYDKKAEEFLFNIKKYSAAIISMSPDDAPLLITMKNTINAASTNAKKKYAEQVFAVLFISNVLQEKRTYLHTKDEPCVRNNYPRIEAPCEVSKLFEDIHTYRIVVEGILLCEASTFLEAILCLLAAYFIFNITYPEQSFNTFVVMEKVFLDANDTDGNDIDELTSQVIRLIKLKTNPKS